MLTQSDEAIKAREEKLRKLEDLKRKRQLIEVRRAAKERERHAQNFERETVLENGLRFHQDPVGWAHERTGVWLWSKQQEVLESVRDNRRTAVRSCHGAGKSFIAATAAAWWIASHPPGEAFVVTSAPTSYQVKAILWREIARAHARARLPGRLNQTEWYLAGKDESEPEELVAFGRKPPDYEPDAFQGIHSRYVLVILDEAAGIPNILWETADTLVTNDESRMLAIGNPTDPLSHFAQMCKPGSTWNTIKISYDLTPNFTGELRQALLDEELTKEQHDDLQSKLISRTWVDEKRIDYGEGTPLWQARVAAEFPDQGDDTLIPLSWIEQAMKESSVKPPAGAERRLGVDVARFGTDSTIGYMRTNKVVHKCVLDVQGQDTMQVAGRVMKAIRDYAIHNAFVDEIGLGAGVIDRLKEQKVSAHGVNVSKAPYDKERFVNLRAELYWTLREAIENGELILPGNDDELAAQLSNIKYKITSGGKIQIESKEEMAKRGLSSPDRADALMLTFASMRKRAQVRVSQVA